MRKKGESDGGILEPLVLWRNVFISEREPRQRTNIRVVWTPFTHKDEMVVKYKLDHRRNIHRICSPAENSLFSSSEFVYHMKSWDCTIKAGSVARCIRRLILLNANGTDHFMKPTCALRPSTYRFFQPAFAYLEIARKEVAPFDRDI